MAGDDFGPPFPWDARHVKAWLRANDPDRDAFIVREGENVREYPDSLRPDAAHMINARRRTCSNPFCRKGVGDCVHLLEDDFRSGRFKGAAFRGDARLDRVEALQGGRQLALRRADLGAEILGRAFRPDGAYSRAVDYGVQARPRRVRGRGPQETASR